MFKIGNFSKIGQVSIKTLHHWDEIDLLKPAHTDKFTGYRYYTIEQLQDVNRIVAFKAMGLSLTQIKKLLIEGLSADEMRGMLRLKKAEIEQQIEQAHIMLNMIEGRLDQIETDADLPNYEAIIKEVPAQPVLTIHETFTDFNELVDCILLVYRSREQVKNCVGPLHALFYGEDFVDTDVEVALSLPMSARAEPIQLTQNRVLKPDELPEVDMVASTVHHGSWMSLSKGYGYLGHWIQANGYEIVDIGREIFHHIAPEESHTETVTEIQFPVRRTSTAIH